MKLIFRLGSLLVALSTLGCMMDDGPTSSSLFPAGEVEGFKPIYSVENDIRRMPARHLENPGKIYRLGTFLFISENGKGVHVIDNTFPTEPRNLFFVEIPGCTDLAIKENILYANNGPDLVAIDISLNETIEVRKRIEGAFPNSHLLVPPNSGVYFECIDEKKGIVIGWERTTLNNPKCYR